jgi:hypothetical protein
MEIKTPRGSMQDSVALQAVITPEQFLQCGRFEGVMLTLMYGVTRLTG